MTRGSGHWGWRAGGRAALVPHIMRRGRPREEYASDPYLRPCTCCQAPSSGRLPAPPRLTPHCLPICLFDKPPPFRLFSSSFLILNVYPPSTPDLVSHHASYCLCCLLCISCFLPPFHSFQCCSAVIRDLRGIPLGARPLLVRSAVDFSFSPLTPCLCAQFNGF